MGYRNNTEVAIPLQEDLGGGGEKKIRKTIKQKQEFY
jgi:hypothetical protein